VSTGLQYVGIDSPQTVGRLGQIVRSCGQYVGLIGQTVAVPSPVGQMVATGSQLQMVICDWHSVGSDGQMVTVSAQIVGAVFGHCVSDGSGEHLVSMIGHLASMIGHSVRTSGQ